jgi:hypothetical protein
MKKSPKKTMPWKDKTVASNGRTIQENFKDWFRGSEVTDFRGNPIVMYHGTCRAEDGIAVFDTLAGEVGSHFGTIDQAHQFVYDQEGAIYPVYLCIKNPLRLMDLGSFSGDGDEVFDQLSGLGIPEPKTKGLKGNDYLRARILDAGYDGIVYLNRREGSHDPFGPDGVDGDELNSMSDEEVMDCFPDAQDSWIAMHPHQIKSAVGNSGLYLKDGLFLTDSKDAPVPKNETSVAAETASAIAKAKKAKAVVQKASKKKVGHAKALA